MASQSYERVSAFREATMLDAEDEQPAQRPFRRTQIHENRSPIEFNYKPLVLRHASLLVILLVVSGLIGILQYVVIKLPHTSTQLGSRNIKARSQDASSLHRVERRQHNFENSSSQTTTLEQTLETAYLHPSSTETTAYTTAASAYVDTKSSVTISQSSQDTPNTLVQTFSDYVATKTTSTILANTAKSAYVHTQTSKAKGSAVPDSLADESKATVVYRTWDAERTFLGTYLAVLIAVIYRMLWMMLYNSFNLIDPFLQLMAPAGAAAGTAFFSFYQSQSNLLGPVPALANKRWALSFVATAYAIAGVLPAFASESIFVDTNWDCPEPNIKNKNNPCNPRIAVDVTIIRVLQSLLGFTAAVIIGISAFLVFKKTGLPTDPRSMATIGSLMQNPALIDDLNDIPVHSTRGEMQQAMRDKRYKLGFYKCSSGEQEYGIRPMLEDGSSTASTYGSFKYARVEGHAKSRDERHSAPHRLRFMDCLLLLASLGAFGVVLAYYLDDNSDGFNDFFNSNTFGPRFILTLSGTLIASMWKSVEQTAIVMAPYIRLSRGPSSPRGTILFTPSSTPISSTWKSLRSGYVLVTVITLITLLAEGLNLTISGVSYASGQTWQQFIASTYISMAVLAIIIITSTLVIISRFREPRVPRNPDTLGAVMSYMSGSRMLDDFAGVENTESYTRDRSIVQAGKRYHFKEAFRIDGKVAWKVDETSKHSSYYS